MSDAPLTAKERIAELLKAFNLSIKGLAEQIKLPSPQILYEITYGRTKSISQKVAEAIRQEFPYVSYIWLLTGEGDMLEPVDGEEHEYTNVMSKPEVQAEKPADTAAKRMQMLSSVLDGWELVYDFRGDYMAPTIKSGELLLLARWEEDFYAWGKIHYVETLKGYITVGYLYPSKHDGHIICRHEDSAKHPDMEIPVDSIKSLYIVRGQLTIR